MRRIVTSYVSRPRATSYQVPKGQSEYLSTIPEVRNIIREADNISRVVGFPVGYS